MIFQVSVMSDGSYTCVPTNKVGTGKNASVIVVAVGKFTSILPSIKKIVWHYYFVTHNAKVLC